LKTGDAGLGLDLKLVLLHCRLPQRAGTCVLDWRFAWPYYDVTHQWKRTKNNRFFRPGKSWL